VRIAQLANFVGPASGGMKTAVQALAAGYVAAGAERLLVMPGPRTSARSRRAARWSGCAPRVGGYRLILEPWQVIGVRAVRATSIEMSDKSTLLPVTGWARRNRVGSLLFSHERLDAMIALRTGWETGVQAPVAVLNRVLVRRFDAVVVTSGFAESEFAPLAVPARTPLHRVPLGVDLETFHWRHPVPMPAAVGARGRLSGRKTRTSRSRPRSRCTAAGCR
jgi:alpha-1,6-mannosyltransferase